MPIYEYNCRDCGENFEKMIRFSDQYLIPTCPNCKNQNTQKKISTVASIGGTSSGLGGSTSSSCGSSRGFS
jgi:putative FmdB family regulatory protein